MNAPSQNEGSDVLSRSSCEQQRSSLLACDLRSTGASVYPGTLETILVREVVRRAMRNGGTNRQRFEMYIVISMPKRKSIAVGVSQIIAVSWRAGGNASDPWSCDGPPDDIANRMNAPS